MDTFRLISPIDLNDSKMVFIDHIFLFSFNYLDVFHANHKRSTIPLLLQSEWMPQQPK